MDGLLTLHQEQFIAQKMNGGGYSSAAEVVREALRVYELNEQEDSDPQMAANLREALRSPSKKYQPGHFAGLGA
jgi:putative addiction module CopG family antidote